MQKQIIIVLFVTITLALLSGVVFLLIKDDQEVVQEAPLEENDWQILGHDFPGVDTVSARDDGERVQLKNETHGYSVSFPNAWRAETQRNAMKFYPEGERGEGGCLINVHIFDPFERHPSGEEFIQEEGKLIRSWVEDIEGVGVGNYSGWLVRNYHDGEIISEGVYIPKNDRVFAFFSAYGQVKGAEEPAPYRICRPLFEDFLSTLTIH